MKTKKVAVLMLLIIISSVAIMCINVDYGSTVLKKFGSYEELKQFLRSRKYSFEYREYGLGRFVFSEGSESYSSGPPKSMDVNDYSKTNVQVEGVDEADIVKTNGEYLYVVSGQKVVVVKAYPAEEATVQSKIIVNGTPNQIFLNRERLVMFCEDYSGNETKTFIDVYDASDKKNPSLKREIAIDGCYFNSRMIGDYVYVITRKGAWVVDDEADLPKIYVEGEVKVTSANEVCYSDISDYGYTFTTITAVNVQEDGLEPSDETILSGWSTRIYVSIENIYLAIGDGDKTIVHRIHVENGEISYAADGEVPGTVLNQFSMDEHEGCFRIATTSQVADLVSEPFALLSMQNNVYILNMDLVIVGKLENVAPGESIHSSRFMGDVCYLVTFRKVDPFFVIDLSDPYNPRILGELKISGYSDYLHLYDENHMIGLGKETVVAEEGDFSWYQGVKISLFDVTEMSEPKELAKYEIGDRGTDSPVLSDHKAFMFSREKNLLVIPVSVAKIDEHRYPYGVPADAFGEIVWQGAYVFTVSATLEEKLVLKGTITHVNTGNVHDASYHVTRALYIGGVLYTISNSKIKMNSILDLSEIKELNLNE